VASRALGPVLPSRLGNMGPSYLRWRADEIARGPLGRRGGGDSRGERSPAQARAA
jgi:hypothetical protein